AARRGLKAVQWLVLSIGPTATDAILAAMGAPELKHQEAHRREWSIRVREEEAGSMIAGPVTDRPLARDLHHGGTKPPLRTLRLTATAAAPGPTGEEGGPKGQEPAAGGAPPPRTT